MTERDDTPGDVSSNDDGDARTFRWSAGDGPGGGPSQTAIEGVAEVTETNPTRLRPLYEVIDPEGLDSLFAPTNRRDREAVDGHVSFSFEGCKVVVHADGRVVVTPMDGDPR